MAIIRALVAAGAKLDAVNKDNLTPLLLAEKPEPPPPPGNNNDPNTFRPKRDTREEVIAALRELMHLGPDDPAPVPPPPPPEPTTRRPTRRRHEARPTEQDEEQTDEEEHRRLGDTAAEGQMTSGRRSIGRPQWARRLSAGAVLSAQSGTPDVGTRRRPPRQPCARGRRRPSSAAEAAKYRAWLNKNCVGCHNSRTASPADAPVNLESASLDDLLPQAATWERVLRKLSVRAMPPQGMPHPTEAEYVGFTTWLAGSLDRAWEGRSTPGRYVVHRLNRTEYAQRGSRSARRSTSTSPSCCRATAPTSASTTSPPR